MTDDDRSKLSRAVREFTKHDWVEFVRGSDFLNLPDHLIHEIEITSAIFPQKKYNLVRAWFDKASKANDDTTGKILENLENLKESFFRQKRSTNTISPVGDIGGASADQPHYDMRGKKGCALIITNSFENDPSRKRARASAMDIKNMESLWKGLNCKLYKNQTYKDQSAKEMTELLDAFSKIEEKHSYVVVVISTHGSIRPKRNLNPKLESDSGGGGIPDALRVLLEHLYGTAGDEVVLHGNDGESLSETEILKCFHNTSTSEALRNIPKIFILNYCRGKVEDPGVKSKSVPDAALTYVQEVNVHEESDRNEPESANPWIPTVSDILTVYATHRDFCAFNDDEKGSWLIASIKEVFESNWEEKTVMEMLTMVNAAMKTKGKHQKAMSMFNSSLVKELKFVKTESSDNTEN